MVALVLKKHSWCWKQWVEILEACFEDQHGSSNHSQHITNSNSKIHFLYGFTCINWKFVSKEKTFLRNWATFREEKEKDVKGTYLNMILKVEFMRMVLPGGVLGLTLVPTRRVKTSLSVWCRECEQKLKLALNLILSARKIGWLVM